MPTPTTPKLSRRRLFGLLGAAAVAPPIAKKVFTVSGFDAAGAPMVETIAVSTQAISTISMHPSALWPGVKRWWEREYAKDGAVVSVYGKVFDAEEV